MPILDKIAQRYPTLFHMAAVGSWPSIAKHGLLSTSALLDLFGVGGAERVAIEASHRAESATIRSPVHGTAIVRDQKPMDDRGLVRALRDGLQPTDWYRTLNSKVFFWVQRRRLETMMGARAYRHQPKTVIFVRTSELLQRHAARVVLAPINTGSTKPIAHERGLETFLPVDLFPYEERIRKHREAIVELAVEGSVPDLGEIVDRVDEVSADGTTRVIFERR